MDRKLRLDVDALAVESIEADRDAAGRGTAHGHALSDTTCNQRLCDCSYFDEDSCMNTCGCGGGGGSAGCTVTCPQTYDPTCATGNQRLCSCG